MTQYSQLKTIYRNIHQTHADGKSVKELWQQFVEVAQQPGDSTAGPFDAIRDSLDEVIGDNPKDSLRVLDHGCGGGMKIFYAAAIGYTNIYGVNVNNDVQWLNDILKELYGYEDTRFYQIDGKHLPFPDDSLDMIISCQVLEHVSDEHIESYYSEEARVLVDGGHVLHEVPHSFTPYDAHSRLWCAHWFPPFLRPLAFGVLKSIQLKKNLLMEGKTYADWFCGTFVRTRSPIYHRKMLKKHFGAYKDLTKKRLLAPHNWGDYDPEGSLVMRRLVDFLVKLPIMGPPFLWLFSNLVMLQTLATKKPSRPNAV